MTSSYLNKYDIITAHRDVGTIHVRRNFALHVFPFSSLFCRILSSNIVHLNSFFTKMLKMCTSLSVKFAFCLNTAYTGPDLRGKLRNTIAFTDSQTENKPVKASPTIPPGPDCIICRFFSVCKLSDCYHLSIALFQ